MDARYTIRKNQLLDECQVAPEIFAQVMPRLHTFMEPFVDTFQGQALSHHVKTYVSGLLSDVARKTSNRSPIMLGKTAWGCKASSAGPTGTMPPCERRCLTKLARNWDKAMACWCSIPRRFQNPVASRWAWPDSGVAAWGKSTPVT